MTGAFSVLDRTDECIAIKLRTRARPGHAHRGPSRRVIIASVPDHGAGHADPELLERQLTTFQGACSPECEDVQIAVHVP